MIKGTPAGRRLALRRRGMPRAATTRTTGNAQATGRTHGPFSRFADWVDTWAPIKLLRVVEVVVIIVALVAFWLELEQRGADRAVRIATLFAQIAQVHALPNGAGLKALKPSVAALAAEGVRMRGIDLSGVDLDNSDLAEAHLFGSNLKGAGLSYSNLANAWLLAANLSEAELTGANLRSAVLEVADLRGARLIHANLAQADLSNANLAGATLISANLSEANLRGANLEGANLSRSNLAGAKSITQQQLDEACSAPKEPPQGLGDDLEWRGKPCFLWSE